ncbi:MAG: DUF4286 family protein [Saprospiraceae bacterium]
MIIYNVTVKINASLEEEWTKWMKTVHIPDVLKTNLFKEYKLCKVLHDDGDGGVTFAIQYFCESMDDFQLYQKEHAPALQKEHTERYDGQYVAFRTLMEVVGA